MELPIKYLEEMKQLLKEDLDKYLNSFNDEPICSIRINNHKISNMEFEKISPFNLEKIDWINNGYYLNEAERPGKHPFYDAGLYYVQEASAMTPAACLEIEEGDRVLDCCAAPGGKTTELLSKLNNTGHLIANDISVSRAYALAKNIQRLGFNNAIVTANDTNELLKFFPEYFDKILVDAPCSGEGMFRKDESLIKSWNEKDSSFYPSIQKEILDSAVSMLKPGGKILYSTCTFAKVEDEDVIEDVLAKHPDLKVIPLPIKYDNFECGISTNTKEAIRLYPHKLKGEGHFICLLQKDGIKTKNKEIDAPSSTIECVQEFLKDTNLNTTNRHYELIKDELYLVPNTKPLKGIRIVLSGLDVGTIRNNRFTPSTPLALSLINYKNMCKLDENDERVIKFLKGETITCDVNLKGWVLVCVKDYPLGFAKADKGMLKNKISKGWTRQ